jgi:diguanylate cyclase (GGDEF)-like protein/putative nucleotidyltransferase with HDIG domain
LENTTRDLVVVPDSAGLPIFPLVSSRLLDPTAERTTFEDMVRILQTDQALALKVLRVVNTPFYGLRTKVSTLPHALAMLGPHAVKSMIEGADRYGPIPGPAEQPIDKYFFWQHSLTTAIIAEAIGKRLGYDVPEEAYLAGLLHDIGKLLVEQANPAGYAEVIREMEKNEAPVPDIEHRLVGIDHAEAGGFVAERWNLSPVLVDAIRFHHHEFPSGDPPVASAKGKELAAIVSYADFIAWSQGLGSVQNGHIPVHNHPPPEIIQMLKECLLEVMDEVDQRLRQVAGMFGLTTSGVADFRAVFSRHHPRLRAASRPTELQLLEERRAELMALTDIIREIRRLTVRDEILDALLRGVHTRLGFDRVSFLQLNQGSSELLGLKVHDPTELRTESNRVSFVLGIDEEGITKALLTGRPTLLRREGLDAKIVDFLGVKETVAAPVVVSERPVGVLLADSFLTERPIAAEQMEAVALCCLEAGLAVENRMLHDRSRELRILAEKDPLTEVANRRSALEHASRELSRARELGSPLSLVLVDIDHFKNFNDRYGHKAGDFVLKEVARIIQNTSRKDDVVARYGGEEFLVLLPETPVEKAILYAERVRSRVEEYGKEIRDIFPDCELTISLGLSSLKGTYTLEEFVEKVDRALYSAKERGRNRVCVD